MHVRPPRMSVVIVALSAFTLSTFHRGSKAAGTGMLVPGLDSNGQLEEKLAQDFSLRDRIPIIYDILDESDPMYLHKYGELDEMSSPLARRFKQTSYAKRLHGAADPSYTAYYGATDLFLRDAFRAHPARAPDGLKGATFAVIGSVDPWYQTFAAVVGHASAVIVIEYQQIVSQHPEEAQSEALANLYQKIVYLTPANIRVLRRIGTGIRVDAVLSVSSIEHDGLGRYGDPLDPNGDLKSMANHRALLLGTSVDTALADIASFNNIDLPEVNDPFVCALQDGNSSKNPPLLYLSMPVGKDCLVFNLHRIYGRKRLKMLLRGWSLVGFFDNNWKTAAASPEEGARRLMLSLGAAEEQLELGYWNYQPVLVLTPRIIE